jgi:hypothetical protein
MMSRANPWDEIGTPDADYTVRRVAESGRVPLFWGKDKGGACLLIVDLEGDHSAQFRRDGTSVHGIGVDLRQGDDPGNQRLVLTLEKHVDRDLFFGLCETLVFSLAPVVDLAGRKTGGLSPEQVRGLFAELQFLRSLYRERLTATMAVDGWCGADRVQQDFIFGDTAIEVKSLSGRERNAVRISSEDQLESLTAELFLAVYRLSELPDSDLAASLNELVRSIESEVADADALEQFSHKLAAYGYAPLPEYDAPRFLVSELQTYRVRDGFPRLVRSEIPNGIVRLSYDIELETIRPFKCDSNEILGSA